MIGKTGPPAASRQTAETTVPDPVRKGVAAAYLPDLGVIGNPHIVVHIKILVYRSGLGDIRSVLKQFRKLLVQKSIADVNTINLPFHPAQDHAKGGLSFVCSLIPHRYEEVVDRSGIKGKPDHDSVNILATIQKRKPGAEMTIHHGPMPGHLFAYPVNNNTGPARLDIPG